MALVDSSENAILDLSKKINYREPENRFSMKNMISRVIGRTFPTDETSVYRTVSSSEVATKDGMEPHLRIESNIPDSQLFGKTRNEFIRTCHLSVSSSPGDVHPLVESTHATSTVIANDRDPSSVWMRTLPHRKRPLTILEPMEASSDFVVGLKRAKSSLSEEVCSLTSEKNDDQESLASDSRSPDMFSPGNTPDKCESATHGNGSAMDKSRLSSVKLSTRTRGGQLKDEAYWERRRKNNEAAKRSRDTRKQKEEETAHKARSLAQENISLRAEINILRTQLCNMQSMLFYRTNAHSLM